MNGTAIPPPEVGQVWREDDTAMRISEVTDEIIRLEDVESGSTGSRYTIIPRSMWPANRFEYVSKQ